MKANFIPDTPTGRAFKTLLPPKDRFKLLNWFTIGLGFWLVIYPYPYQILFPAVIALPIIGVILKRISNQPFESLLIKGKININLESFLFVSAWILFIRDLIDFEPEDFYKLAVIGGVAFILMLFMLFALLGFVDKSNPERLWIYVIVIFNIAVYSYSAAFAINCIFDNSKPIVYKSRVLDKTVYSTKGTIYKLTVGAWGNHKKSGEISVTRSQFYRTNIGDTIKIDYQKGLLGIPWHDVQ